MVHHGVIIGLCLGIPALIALLFALVTAFRKQIADWIDFKVLYSKPNKETIGFLRGNFAPTPKEETIGDLPVKGEIPQGLSGLFLRNGPNPYFQPLGRYHWFDGDGMVHGVRLKGGKCSYANRWIETSRLRQEKRYGRPVFMKIGELTGKEGLLTLLSQAVKCKLGLVDISKGAGQANTALVYHGRKLLALHEGDLPYVLQVLCNGAVETLMRAAYDEPPAGEKNGRGAEPSGEGQGEAKDGSSAGASSHPVTTFTAHPKVDAATGEMHFFGYNIRSKPHLTYGVVDREGNHVKSIDIDLPAGPAMMHDFALTKTYAIILYMPLFFKPKEMVGGSGFPFVFEPDFPSKFALLRRDATDASGIQWFDLPAGMIFHTANAWDDPKEEGKVHMYACSTADYSLGDLLSSTSTRYPGSPQVGMPDSPSQDQGGPGGGRSGKNGKSGTLGGGGFIPGAHGGMSLMNGTAHDLSGNPASFAVPNRYLRSMNESSKSRLHSSTLNSKASSFASRLASRKSSKSSVNSSPSQKKDLLNLSGEERSADGDTFTLFHFVFDTTTGTATQQKLLEPEQACDAYLLEFPQVNPRFHMRPCQFVYMACFCDGMKTNGVVKVDITRPAGENVVASATFAKDGKKRFGGECLFVPAEGEEALAEDEGWLLTYVFEHATNSSYLLILDAKTLEEVAEVELKTRVPYGFHSLFLNEEQVQNVKVQSESHVSITVKE